MIHIGKIRLKDSVDVTDPCYSKGTWCRENYKCVPGIYNCYIDTSKRHGVVSVIRIVLDDAGIMEKADKPENWEEVGLIGVDAGLAGFFDDKPDFSDLEWQKFCSDLDFAESCWIRKYDGRDGFFGQPGFGDGCYPVYGIYKNLKHAEIAALEIRCL